MTQASLISIFDSLPIWVTLAPLFASSILLVAVAIERLVFFYSTARDGRGIVEPVMLYVEKGDLESAGAFLAGKKGPLAELLADAVIYGKMQVSEAVLRGYGERALKKIERFIGTVSTISTVSPMLGLLGTVTGMMKSFSGLSKMGGAAQELLAGGITEALVTTALGLIIAIPALILYNYLVSIADQGARDIEMIINRLAAAGKK